MDASLLIPMVTGPVVMLVLAAVALGAAAGRIPRNHIVGIRLRSTLASDTAWHAGHRAAITPAFISLGVTVIADLAVVLLSTAGVSTARLSVVLVVPVIVCGVWIVAASMRAARKAAERAG